MHTTLTQEQQLNNGDQERCTYLEPANRIMETIRTHPRDYSQRDINTKRKETPSTKYLEEINQAINVINGAPRGNTKAEPALFSMLS